MKRKVLDADEIIRRIELRQEDFRKIGVKKLGLFGSYLKGKQKRGSDVDILVEFNEVTWNNYFDALDVLKKILKRKIDLIIEKDLKSELSYVKKEASYAKL